MRSSHRPPSVFMPQADRDSRVSVRHQMERWDLRAIKLEMLRRGSHRLKDLLADNAETIDGVAATHRWISKAKLKKLSAFDGQSEKYCDDIDLIWLRGLYVQLEWPGDDWTIDDEDSIVANYIIRQIHARRAEAGERLPTVSTTANRLLGFTELASVVDQESDAFFPMQNPWPSPEATKILKAHKSGITDREVLAIEDWRYARWFLGRFYEYFLRDNVSWTESQKAIASELRLRLSYIRKNIVAPLQFALFESTEAVVTAINNSKACSLDDLSAARVKPSHLAVGLLTDAEQVLMNMADVVQGMQKLVIPSHSTLSKPSGYSHP